MSAFIFAVVLAACLACLPEQKPEPVQLQYSWERIDGQRVYVGCPGGADQWRPGFEGCVCQVHNADNVVGTGLCADLFPQE